MRRRGNNHHSAPTCSQVPLASTWGTWRDPACLGDDPVCLLPLRRYYTNQQRRTPLLLLLRPLPSSTIVTADSASLLPRLLYGQESRPAELFGREVRLSLGRSHGWLPKRGFGRSTINLFSSELAKHPWDLASWEDAPT